MLQIKFDCNRPAGLGDIHVWKCGCTDGRTHARTPARVPSYKLTLWAFSSGELKIHCFNFFPYKSIRDQIWPCRKKGQGQPRVIIWINLVVLMHTVLHTKFQGHQPFCSGKEDLLRFFLYMGMAAILVMRPGPFEQTFVPPSHWDSTWNMASNGSEVSEKIFENTDTHTDDRGLAIL